ncbi:GPI mannosyltransferase 3 protein [Sesbania bispinosa]|nr:GPI mannosyltransferase 3 protein [Sesbania bispinosa]
MARVLRDERRYIWDNGVGLLDRRIVCWGEVTGRGSGERRMRFFVSGFEVVGCERDFVG